MITIQPFVFNAFQVNSYILFDETKEAIIIDPAFSEEEEFEGLKKFINKNELKIRCIANTHCHVDHVVGVNRMKNEFDLKFYAHPDEKHLLKSVVQQGALFGFNIDSDPSIDKEINEDDQLKFGNSSLNIIHVPGHSPGSIVFYAPDDKLLIAGDVLFSNSIGRTDLPGGNHQQLINGIKQKLLTLPGDVMVFPGHGPKTTIKQEHDTNPFLN